MSERYQTRLVDGDSSSYEQFALGVTAGSLVVFALAVGTFADVVPLADEVGGLTAATYFGVATLGLGLATAALGVLSRWGNVQTTPDRSAGLVVGLIHALLWTLPVGAFLGNTLGVGQVGWLGALVVGLGVGYATIALREDLGATLPASVLVCLIGVVFTTGVISPEWMWEPSGFGATIPGRLLIPLSVMFAGLVTGWASASATEGFGTRGRQNGAFVLVSLVVMLTLSVLVFLLLFVFQRGIGVVVENLVVSAGTVVVLLATSMFVLLRVTTVRPAAANGTDKIIAFVSLAIVGLVGLAAAAVLGTVVTNSTLSGYAVTIEPTAAVGAGPGLLAAGVLLAMTGRSGDWSPETARGRWINRGLNVSLVGAIGITIVELAIGTELAVAGVAAVTVLLGGAGLGVVVLAATRPSPGQSGEASSLPPVSWLGYAGLALLAVASLRALLTGYPVGTSQLGIVGNGTVTWPFIMNASQGLGIQTGVMPAMFGTIWIVLGAVVFAMPLALGAAVYLTEYAEDSVFTRAVDVATNGLWSTPSIVFGLFGLAFIVPRFGDTPSILASQLVLGFMLLPLVLITSREAMKSVPDEYRDASAALGVTKWQTIRSVVIPASMPGVITGVILGVGRIAGETAPLLLVLNGPNFPNSGPKVLQSFVVQVGAQPPFIQVSNPALLERASALPYQLYAVITAGVGAGESFGWGTALVLLGVVLGFFAMSIATRRYFERKLHQ